MKADAPELMFPSREEFRTWLYENAETSDGVWLVFGKKKAVVTLTANEALEEALCFGWIDGQMKSVDDTKYIKYFSRRRAKSVWSVKNKTMVEAFKEKLSSFPSAYEKFLKLPPSTQLAEVRWYHLYKSKERQEITFKEIIEKLNKMQ